MTTQLGLDGTEVPYPLPSVVPLTERQREVLAYVRRHGVVRPLEIGRLMHSGRPWHAIPDDPGPCCEYASSDGCDALRRLERRGLVRHVARGQWVPERFPEHW